MKYTVWNYADGGTDDCPVESVATAKKLIKDLIKVQLKDDEIVFNAFGLTVTDESGDSWEWSAADDGGDDVTIMELIDAEENEARGVKGLWRR